MADEEERAWESLVSRLKEDNVPFMDAYREGILAADRELKIRRAFCETSWKIVTPDQKRLFAAWEQMQKELQDGP